MPGSYGLLQTNNVREYAKNFSASRWLSITALIACAYFLAAKLGLSLAFVNASATAVWPPTAIAFSALLLLGYGFSPAVFLGAFFANLTVTGNALTSLFIALGNTLEALLGVFLVNRLSGGQNVFKSLPNISGFVIFAGFVSTAVSATIGTTTLVWANLVYWLDYIPVWLTWWLGDVTGNLVFSPFLLLLFMTPRDSRWGSEKAIEAVFLSLSVLLVGLIVFGDVIFAPHEAYPTDFLIMPIVIWAAMRFGQFGAAAATVTFSSMAIWGTLHGFGPFVRASANESLLLLQIFMGFTSVASIGLARIYMDKEQHERQLKEEKASQDAILMSIGYGLIVADRDGAIMFLNPRAEQLFGLNKEDVLGKPVSDIIPVQYEDGTPVPKDERPLMMALRKGESIDTAGIKKYYSVHADGTRFPVDVTATPVQIAGEVAGAICVIKDATLEMEADASKTDFISIAAHQLRTPLSSAKWLIELLLEGDLSKSQRQKLEDVATANERLINIVHDLLNITRLESGKAEISTEPFNVNEVVDNELRLYQINLEQKKLRLNFERSPVDCVARSSELLFRESLKNVLNNSFFYSPKGSTVSVKIFCNESGFTVTVTNEGPAITPAEQKNLFKKFYRGTEAVRIRPFGSGLGLYIAKLNLETLGGSISCISPVAKKKGAIFVLRLPLQTKLPQVNEER